MTITYNYKKEHKKNISLSDLKNVRVLNFKKICIIFFTTQRTCPLGYLWIIFFGFPFYFVISSLPSHFSCCLFSLPFFLFPFFLFVWQIWYYIWPFFVRAVLRFWPFAHLITNIQMIYNIKMHILWTFIAVLRFWAFLAENYFCLEAKRIFPAKITKIFRAVLTLLSMLISHPSPSLLVSCSSHSTCLDKKGDERKEFTP